MKTSLKNFTKVLLGVAVLGTGAGAAVYAHGQKSQKLTKQTTMVGKIGTDHWVEINPSEQNESWRCTEGDDVCTGTLKPNATPNPDGSYNNSEVNFSSEPQDQQFELIP